MSFLMQFKDWVSQSVGIDDACDRLNRKYTSLMLLICVVPLFGKQYIGEPIEVRGRVVECRLVLSRVLACCRHARKVTGQPARAFWGPRGGNGKEREGKEGKGEGAV